MTPINDKKVRSIAKGLEENPDATVSLEELCEILRLSLKDDSDIIFEILDENVLFINNNPSKFAWTTNKHGFEILCKYAYEKQNCLSIFTQLFISEFRNTNIKKQETEDAINATSGARA